MHLWDAVDLEIIRLKFILQYLEHDPLNRHIPKRMEYDKVRPVYKQLASPPSGRWR